MTVQDAATLLRSHVDATVEALELDGKDSAAVKLARQYADLIDIAHASGQPADISYALRWHGPILIDLLAELGATPSARARVRKGPAATGPPAENDLTRLRSARAQTHRAR